ncbi:Acetylxylan esterase precursor [Pirellulimonas nuda]|uniref:Acetylxylan esterase n=2 Tax=Pirellulimonas nuda TaxID=2528009 RepID=A0A518DBJ6_9BACT|nr:Acetylxylan esterase precursor [Pirellulimonas nuda]
MDLTRFWSWLLCGASCVCTATQCPAAVVTRDVCVYGATVGGITAAIQSARQGKSVVLVEPGRHIGGMTTGGLGATDIGNKGVIGGISREFYQRVAKHYADDAAWRWESRDDFFAHRSKRTTLEEVSGPDATMWTFEPHVAERILNEMLADNGCVVQFQQRLSIATMEGQRIVAIKTDAGDVYRAKIYVDATYEGDLLAMAGVSYRVGREANAQYNETLNGIREHTPKNQIYGGVDPYVVPGDPASGLIPLVQRGSGGIPGDGDQRVQAYNFRLCFTNVAENRRELTVPDNYDPALYELAARRAEKIVESGKQPVLSNFCNPVWMPNSKTDINNSQGISTDFIGMNYDYPDGDYATRDRIWKSHKDYILGFWHFMSTSPRVPQGLRQEFASFGPCKDEFTGDAGWPHQMYVREARRMVSDYVMTEHNCRGKEVADDPVGMAAYGMDSHNCQRIVQDGAARNEGDVQQHGLKPYPISYRAIVPAKGECQNLLAPVCVSATHIAFGSVRMEPVFMVLGQSAGAAAVIAIDADTSVQDVDYQKLRSRLLADGQVLARPAAKSAGPPKPRLTADGAGPPIICFGDSITKRGYPEELAKLLGKQVFNAGVAGNSSRHALQRLQRDVLSLRPEVVVVSLGTNDSRVAEDRVFVPVDEYEANLATIAESCQRAGIRVIFCTVPPIDADAYFTRHRREPFEQRGGLPAVLEDYRAAVVRVADRNALSIVDLNQQLAMRPDWRDQDGVHPTREGNRIIAGLVAEAIRQMPTPKAGNARSAAPTSRQQLGGAGG